MSINITVPEMGESVVEATVGRWLVEAGASVKAGQPLVELETDKVDLEVSAEKAGVLAEILVEAGTDVKIGDVLGKLEPGQAASAEDESEKEDAPQKADEAKAEEAEAKKDSSTPADGGPSDDSPQAEAKTDEANAQPGEEAKVTPVARRMAEDAGMDLSQISGSGSGGRVTKEDVEKALSAQKREAESETASASARGSAPARTEPAGQTPSPFTRPAAEREERVRLSRRRRTIAQRLVEAQHNAAMLTTFNEVDMSAVMDLRTRRRDEFEKQMGVRLGFMSFFTKATIGALKAFPHLNAEIDGDEMILKHYYDIGIAVGAEEGLVVPVVRDADRLSFAQIEQTIRDLAQKTQDGTLALADLQGGSFTITNGGVFGSMLSTPILNAPQVGILGLHKIEQRPVVVDGEIVIRSMMYLALSYDHRIVDGREAVQFLVKVKELIEDPERLLLEG
ncbi:MAG: 2-oxoglutarate dehydrogenase complex dihydrolipoyllysine-residue succinyltransferase [Caldilineaceae bacterium]|nr:2-oxoglutarate dehydrogenase complex dihydrolipoyllysine-residue succinyltransferase [Caldilineaceae bacterium]